MIPTSPQEKSSRWPEWAKKRKSGNRMIALALFGLVALYVVMFVARYVTR
jgi:hypothetical protein